MNFDLSDDQRVFNDHVERMLRETCPVDRLHKAFSGDQDLADTMWRAQLELGLGGLLAPEEHGGLGLGLLEAASIAELIGRAGAPGPFISHTLAVLAIAKAGSDAQKARWLPALAAGEAVGAVALMEGSAWGPDAWKLAEGERLSGAKDYVLGLAEADVFVVALAGGKLALVEANAPGVTRNVWSSTDRTRPIGQLGLDNAPAEIMPLAYGRELFDAALVLTAADAHGGAARMVEDIVEYSKTRVQFGKTIAHFQAVKHKLADLALWVEPNGPLYRQAAATFDQEPEDAPRVASIAKAHIVSTFSEVARTATESYGGIGYTWEHSAHIWLRRSMFDNAWLGGPLDHRERAAALAGW
jgi:alkylation response protein AidB-like acyl-CoA dehydrogenase